MKKEWGTMKKIINAYGQRKDIFLSLINEEGMICCANANMLKSLQLQHPRTIKTNFFDLRTLACQTFTNEPVFTMVRLTFKLLPAMVAY